MTYVKYIWRSLAVAGLALALVVPLRYHYGFEAPSSVCSLQGRFLLKIQSVEVKGDAQPYITLNVTDKYQQWDFKEFLRYHQPEEQIALLTYNSHRHGPALWTNPLMEVEPHYEHDFHDNNAAPNMDIIFRFEQM